jgi:16S rRNA (cytidine1402-2'-O)-methyltransferase
MTVTHKGTLYLLPTPIGENPVFDSVPVNNKTVIDTLRIFVVEEIRTARRFLRKLNPDFPIDDCQFYVLNEHTLANIDLTPVLRFALDGHNIGLISEAGLPCIADPGSDLVLLAQQNDIRVVPLVGPSSIVMTLMASGLCGQHFAFQGYLPAHKPELIDKIHKLEQHSRLHRQTQLFIEAPYRNNQLFDTLLSVCRANTLLCVACNITQNDEYIKTKSIAQWKQTPFPKLHKKPTVFALWAE